MGTSKKLLGILSGIFIFFLPFVYSPSLFYAAINPKFFYVIGFSALLFIYIGYLTLSKNLKIYFSKRVFILSILLLLLSLYLSSFSGVYPERSLWSDILRSSGVFFLSFLAISSFILGEFLNQRDWQFIRRSIAISAGLFALLSFFGRDGLGFTGTFLSVPLGSAGLSLGNSTFAGAYLFLTLAITLIELSRSLKNSKLWWVLIVSATLQIFSPYLFGFKGLWEGDFSIASLVGEARASSVTAWLFLLFIFGFYIIKKSIRGRSLKYSLWTWSAIWFVFISMGITLLFVPNSRVQNEYIEQSGIDRIVIWNQGLEAFKERPILGWGPENFRFAWEKHFDNRLYLDENIGEVWFDRAHNFFIDTLTTTGVVGLSAVFLVLAAYLSIIYRSQRFGLIGAPESVILATIPFAHILQIQTSFDTVVSYTLLAFIAGYVLWLEKEINSDRDQKDISIAAGVLLVALGFVGLYGFTFSEYSRQNALYSVFFRSQSHAEQVGSIRVGTSRTSDFEGLRLTSGSLINGLLDQIASEGAADGATIQNGLEQLSLYEDRFVEYLLKVPEDYRARMNLAYILLIKTALGDNSIDKAKDIIANSYSLSPENPLTYALDSMAELFSGDTQSARIKANQALELNPEIPLSKEVVSYIEEQIRNIPKVKILRFQNI